MRGDGLRTAAPVRPPKPRLEASGLGCDSWHSSGVGSSGGVRILAV